MDPNAVSPLPDARRADRDTPPATAQRTIVPLPTGVVTFLLTDIEGSTASWDADVDAMTDVMATHDAIVSDAIAHHHGVRPVEQGEGDSVVAAFVHAADAVSAALEAQRGLQRMLGDRHRVRMALHSGDAIVRLDTDAVTERYAGPTIIRCARLRGCAHGGQVLVSAATAALLGDRVPDGASVRELGTVALRGLSRREPVHQLFHTDLAASFPPLRELEATPHTVPTPATPFLGREREVTDIRELVASAPIVTITGTGGVGKTRIAQRIAADLLDEFPAGVWWVELAPATTDDALVAAAAKGLTLTISPGVPAIDQFVARLAGSGPTLVVVDNCEHLTEEVGDLVAELSARCPELTVLTTSREPLGLPGERVWRLASLSTPPTGQPVTAGELLSYDAPRLFVERARAARPNLVLDDEAARAIAAICTRLDGVALAVELAAARARAMPLETLASGLDDAFRLLTGGSRTRLPRQQTLLASIDWSIDLLTAPQRSALFRLATCPSTFDLDAAEAIAADGAGVHRHDVLDALMALVDKSLVDFDQHTGSYRMLETIRQYGLDRLHLAGEVQATRRRHAEHWAERSAELAEWRAETTTLGERYIPDLFAALDWAMVEDPALAEQVLANAADMYGYGRWGDLSRACAFMAESRPRSSAWPMAVAHLMSVAAMAGNFDIFALVPDAVAQATALDDRDALHTIALFGVFVAAFTGDYRPAVALFEEATADGCTTPALKAAAGAVGVLGPLGHLDEAERLCDSMRSTLGSGTGFFGSAAGPTAVTVDTHRGRLGRRDDIPSTIASWPFIANMFAAAAAQRGLANGDRELVHLGLRLVVVDSLPTSMTGSTVARWASAMLDGEFEQALATAAVDAPATADALTLLPLVAMSLAALERWAEVTIAVDQFDAALSSIAVDAPLPATDIALARARVALAGGGEADRAAAERWAHSALELASTAGLRLREVDALETVAAVALLSGDSVRAARLAGAALHERERCGYRCFLWSALDRSSVEALRLDHADGWAEGTALAIDEAVELARRTRGPRGRPSFGVDALTPTERLVAEHVARGMTNREIAAVLLVSPATVKTHVSRILTKLGARNRAELATIIRR